MTVSERYMPRCRIFLLDGEKFRTNLFVLFFDLPLKRETATETALLAEVLRKTDWQEAAKQAEDFYGAIWDVSVVKKGDRQLLLFSLETLQAVETEEAVAFLRQRILQPLEKGCFDKEMVERQKKGMKRKLEALRDNKRAYTRKRVLEETAEGTAYAVSGDGYQEDLEEISAKNLFDFYQDMVETAEVKLFFCGGKEDKQKVLSLRKDFWGKTLWKAREMKDQPKNGPRFVQEHAEMEQARLMLGFSADAENGCRKAALILLNQLLGGSPDSLLFRKIREEKGLCYDVRSYLEPMSPYLFVQAGIDGEDAKETGKLILNAIEQLKEEGVLDEKLQQAKENIIRDYDGMTDSPWAMVDFCAEQILQGNPPTTEKFLRQIRRADGEDILRAANHLELKVVYLLSGKEDTHDAE